MEIEVSEKEQIDTKVANATISRIFSIEEAKKHVPDDLELQELFEFAF